jgi:hypothetical protein
MIPPVTPAVLHMDETMRMAHFGCVVGVVWLDAPRLTQMQTFASHSRRVSKQHDGSFLFNLIVDGTPSFDSKVREEAHKLTVEGVNRRGAAHVILVEGFRGAAVRAFLGSMLMLNKPKTPTKVVADVHSATAFACECLGGGRVESDSRTLVRFVEWAVSREGEWPRPW